MAGEICRAVDRSPDKEGAWYFSNDASGCIPAFPTQVVDTIGAGDSHAGGVLAGLASGLPLADAVLLGNAVASWVVGHRAVIVRQRARNYLAQKTYDRCDSG